MWWVLWGVVGMAGASEKAPFGGPGETIQHMHGHFEAASRAVWSATLGDLDKVREAGADLTYREKDLPISWRRYFNQMRRAAKRLEKAEDLPEAAARTAALGQTCADCHVGVVGGPTLKPSQAKITGSRSQQDHALAWYWLWLGVVMADERAWTNGAAAMHLPPTREGTEDLRAAYAALAEEAQAVPEERRDNVFGEVLATCAACHDAAGVALTPPPASDDGDE